MDMYAYSSDVGLHLRELPSMANRTEGMMSSDRSLSLDFPLSPSNQLMYEEPLQDQCCVGGALDTDKPVHFETRVISPSVEVLTFEDCDVFFTTGPTPPVELSTSCDELAGQSADEIKYQLKMNDSGPTLTQLNSEDLDATLLDDFSVSSNSFCVDTSSIDCSQLLVAAPAASKAVADVSLISSTTVMLPTCMQQPPQQVQESVQRHQPVLSQLLSSRQQAGRVLQQNASTLTTLSHITGSHATRPHTSASSSSSSSLSISGNMSVTAAQLNLDSSWEAIESFLKSEGERMAAAAESDRHQLQLSTSTQSIKSEVTDVQLYKVTKDNPARTGVSVTVKPESHHANVTSISDAESSTDDNSVCELSELLTDAPSSSGSRKDKTYFWQYNVQSKGPKGRRLCQVVQDDDPYVLHDFEDPVFDSEFLVSASPCYRHSGKARRGDGNDVTPNAAKLYSTGKELRKLTHLINTMCPPGELPTTIRGRTLREKNKFASRICRLKKKAQHEANKIKLYGLEQEHRQLMKVLSMIKREVCQRVKKPTGSDSEKLTSRLDKLMKHHLTGGQAPCKQLIRMLGGAVMTAGHTVDYVNSVLARVAAGDPSGGLTIND